MTTASFASLGLDIAKAKFDAALLQDGHTHPRSFPNTADGFTALQQWIGDWATLPIRACMEATGVYGEALALFLHQQGVTVSVVNPSRIKAFAQNELLRTKTDSGDAVLKHNRPFDPNDAPAT